jgi:hypothetical protein
MRTCSDCGANGMSLGDFRLRMSAVTVFLLMKDQMQAKDFISHHTAGSHVLGQRPVSIRYSSSYERSFKQLRNDVPWEYSTRDTKIAARLLSTATLSWPCPRRSHEASSCYYS